MHERRAHDYVDAFGNVRTRVTVPVGGLTLSCGFVVEDDGLPDPVVPDAVQHPVAELPDDVLAFLLGSRHCETGRFLDTAWSLVGYLPSGWVRVQAIVDFAHGHVEFGYHHARSTKTAWDAYQERKGVCRDFAYLARAVPVHEHPGALLHGLPGRHRHPAGRRPGGLLGVVRCLPGGRLHTSDARHDVPRIGRILMARERDATDTALTTTFGPAVLAGFDVATDEIGTTT